MYCTALYDYDKGCVCIVQPCTIMTKVVCVLCSPVWLRRMLLYCTMLYVCGEGCCAELYNAV